MTDTNMIARLWLPDAETPLAERVLQADGKWAAPVLWRSEFLNVLAKWLRRGAITEARGVEVLEEAESLLWGRQFSVRSSAIWQAVKESPCSAYDCEFAALARDLGLSLVTTDGCLLAHFPDVALHPEAFLKRGR